MSEKYRSALLFGAPGAGKGTQGKMLGQVPGFYHVSSGDMFRGLDPSSRIGQEIRAIMATGELVPDDKTVELWSDHMRRLVDAGGFDPSAELLLLDGIPRNPRQADLMADRIEVMAILFLDAPDREALVQRLKGRAEKEGRPDDAREEVIRNRFDVFDRETSPLLEKYPADLVTRVDPMGTQEEVFERLSQALAPVRSSFRVRA